MTRGLKRQLEQEIDIDTNIGIDPNAAITPRDDDTYSPSHAVESDNEEKPS